MIFPMTSAVRKSRKSPAVCSRARFWLPNLRELLPANVERSAQFLPRAHRPGLASGLNRGDQRTRHLRLLRQPLLGKLPVLAPDAERGLSPHSAFAHLQRNEFILASIETRLRGIVGFHVG